MVASRDVARSLAQAWERRTGGEATLAMAEALHTLAELHDPARPATLLRVGRQRAGRPRRPLAGGVRRGPDRTGIYPPPLRAHGYASSAVAALTRAALDGGARLCMLYTDLANPTSNRIYTALGYRRVADWEELAFVPGLRATQNPPPS